MKSKFVVQEKPLVSVIVLNWNGKQNINACLESMYEFDEGIKKEIIVIDNGSKDGSVELLEKKFPQAKLIKNPVNYGIPKATNQGFRIAKGKYFFLCGNDTEMRKGWLTEPIKLFEKNPRIATVGLLDVGPDKEGIIKPEPVDFERDNVASVAMLTRKKIYDLIGGYDEKYFAPYGGDETDWNYRARALGFKVYRTKRVVVPHKHSADTKKQNPNQYLLLNEHRITAMLFNLSFLQLLGRIPGLSWLAFDALMQGNFLVFLKAIWNNLKKWKTILMERKKRKKAARKILKKYGNKIFEEN
jgi:hypothetical protein